MERPGVVTMPIMFVVALPLGAVATRRHQYSESGVTLALISKMPFALHISVVRSNVEKDESADQSNETATCEMSPETMNTVPDAEMA